jgi:hypothetical protein
MPNSNLPDDDATATDDQSQNDGVTPSGSPSGAYDETYVTAAVARARAEEKRKLYKRMEEQDTLIREMRTELQTLKAAPVPATSGEKQTQSEKIDQLLNAITESREEQKALALRFDRMEAADRERHNRINLERYGQTLIAEVRARDEDVIEALVGGDTEEQVADSVKIAHAEWLFQQKQAEERLRKRSGRPAAVTVQQNSGRPTGTPPVMTANHVEADAHENLDDLVSQDAVRDGTYAEHRKTLLSGLKKAYKYGGQPPA